jgi:hypothetical protein
MIRSLPLQCLIVLRIMIKTPYFTLARVALVGALLGGCVQPPSPPAAAGPPPLLAAGTPAAAAGQAHAAGPVRLRPGHPEYYVVGPEDTLLTVAGVFLEEPWRWQEVWRPAPASNPLYPGQIIELYDERGQPRLRPASGVATIKLSPQVHIEALSQPIPTVPTSAIAGFLKKSIVVSQADWEAAPVLIGNFDDSELVSADHNYIYAVSLEPLDQHRYGVFHPLGEYRDPETGQSLGFGGAYVGTAVLEKAGEAGEPATLLVLENRLEARAGDRLFPTDQYEEGEPYRFTPQAPPVDTHGWVISLLGNNVLAGQYQSVVVNLGAEDGMTGGTMLGVYSTGRGLATPFGFGGKLPSHKIATLMLYKVYDRVSYGLVTETRDVIKIRDQVGEP